MAKGKTSRPVEIKSTSANSAECDPVVLRETSLTRIEFEPDIVNNSKDPGASVRGHLVFKKKAKADRWEELDLERIEVKGLKKGQWLRVELKSDVVKVLHETVTKLYELYDVEGVPQGEHTYVEAPRAVASLLRSLENLGVEDLESVSAVAGLNALRALLKVWQDNRKNSSEEYWQEKLEENAFLLSTLFSHPVVFFEGKGYAGGKRYSDSGGHYPDFLLRSEMTKNAAVIEIKTPVTPLLRAKEYRAGVFAPTVHLAGSVVQVLTAKDSLTEERARLFDRDDPELRAWNPECIVIVGCTDELEDMERRRSFELYRREHAGVRIVTFDELFARIERFIELLSADPE